VARHFVARRVWTIAAGTLIGLGLAAGVEAAPAAGADFWDDAARSPQTQADRARAEAEALARPAATDVARAPAASDAARLARAEARLRALVAGRPGDLAAALSLAETQLVADRPADAAATLARALPRTLTAGGPAALDPATDGARAWFELAVAFSKLGRYGDAADAYTAIVAGGRADAAVYANLGEVLMAAGRLPEAEARYRDAVAVADEEPTGIRRARSQDLALAYYGLAVALDRDGASRASHEMMGRALAEDPGGSMLKVATVPGSDLFFLPEGDVFYYLGLAAELEGRTTDAEAAFREFLARRPGSRWAPAARAHADGGGGASSVRSAPSGGGGRLRVLAVGTVLTSGAIAAPLIDGAWREHPGLLDACLARLDAASAGRQAIRFALELQIDGRGEVAHAAAKVPPPLDEHFARCVESAVAGGLRFPALGGSRVTLTRTEILIGFP
jgi:tetratricopeptide (TPR) repeat protein